MSSCSSRAMKLSWLSNKNIPGSQTGSHQQTEDVGTLLVSFLRSQGLRSNTLYVLYEKVGEFDLLPCRCAPDQDPTVRRSALNKVHNTDYFFQGFVEISRRYAGFQRVSMNKTVFSTLYPHQLQLCGFIFAAPSLVAAPVRTDHCNTPNNIKALCGVYAACSTFYFIPSWGCVFLFIAPHSLSLGWIKWKPCWMDVSSSPGRWCCVGTEGS